MNQPLVTIITPYYNNSSTIQLALRSIFSQTYDQIQHILIDDGSVDFDLSSIQKFIDENKKSNIVESVILQTGKNSGIIKAWNMALPHIKGEYVFSLAADDCFFDKNVIADWVEEFLKTKALVLTAIRAVYDPKLQVFQHIAPGENEIHAIKTFSNQQLINKLAGSNFIFGCCTAFHRDCYKIIGGHLNERYRLVEDYPMVLNLLRNNVHITFFDRVVIKYRLGGISNIGNIDRSYIKEADAIFYNECYPYVTDKKNAKEQYKIWRNRAIIAHDIKIIRKFFNANENKFGLFLYRIVMIIRHPIYMLNKLKRKII